MKIRILNLIVLFFFLGISFITNFYLRKELSQTEFDTIDQTKYQGNKDFPELFVAINKMINKKLETNNNDVFISHFWFESLTELKQKIMHFTWSLKVPYYKGEIYYELNPHMSEYIKQFLSSKNDYWKDFVFINVSK